MLQGRAGRSAFAGAVLWALLCIAHIASATVLATVRGVVHDSTDAQFGAMQPRQPQRFPAGA